MTAGLYPRPSREEIAARVNGGQPPGKTQAPGPLACFAAHLNARMRALGWDQEQLQERAGISAQTAARAMNGTGVSLELAAKLAGLLSLSLPAMVGPYVCHTCDGNPPAGFSCLECGTEGKRR